MKNSAILRAMAVVFGLLAVSNLMKPLGIGEQTGFVFLGQRLSGTPNLIAGWSFAVFLAAYASSLWRERAAALPLGIGFAAYVTTNLYLFTIRMPAPTSEAERIFGIVYTVLALGGAWGAVAAMVRAGYAKAEQVPGRIVLRSLALLFALMALSNALKPFEYTVRTGFVFFGERLSGSTNAAVALSFSAILATYAAGIWMEKSYALRVGIGYALYVAVNLVCWNFRKPEGSDVSMLFGVLYLVSAIGVSSGAAVLLWKHRARLA